MCAEHPCTNYQDDQIQTWRIAGGPPVIAGSVRNWPGVCSGTNARRSYEFLRVAFTPFDAFRAGDVARTWLMPFSSVSRIFWQERVFS
jgi:hypothetical protein